MNKLLLAAFILTGSGAIAQDDSCKIFRDAFQMLAETKPQGEPPYDYRFTQAQFATFAKTPGLMAATRLFRQLQGGLEGANEKYKDGEFWHFERFNDEEKLIEMLKIECPSINMKVFEDEIAFYKSKFVPYNKMDHTYKRKGY